MRELPEGMRSMMQIKELGSAVAREMRLEPRDRNATCVTCGRRGTNAYIATDNDDGTATILRYCRRCFPAAERGHHEDAMKRMHEAGRQMQEWIRMARTEGRPLLPPQLPDEGGTTMAWDWTVKPIDQLMFRLRGLWWLVTHRVRPRKPKYNPEFAGSARHGARPFEDPNPDKRS